MNTITNYAQLLAEGNLGSQNVDFYNSYGSCLTQLHLTLFHTSTKTLMNISRHMDRKPTMLNVTDVSMVLMVPHTINSVIG